VSNAEKLFVHQQSPVWCWAATSQALFNYHHENKKLDQLNLALNNPHATHPQKHNPYYITLDENGNDYLLDKLSDEKLIPFLNTFKNKTVKNLIDKNHPVIL